MKRLRDYQKIGQRRVICAEPDRTYTPIGFGNVRGLVTDATRETEAHADRFRACPGSWRSLVKHRIAVCCEYGDAGLRIKAVY